MHPARERALVAMQCAALAHLEARAKHLPLPHVVQTRKGDAVTEVPGPDGTRRLVWMLRWLPGATLASAQPRSPETLAARIGRLLGEMDRALADFEHPAARRDFLWDLKHAGRSAAELGRIVDPGRRALAGRALARFEREVVPALPGLRRQVIHGDANDHNVVVGDARELPRAVTGLLDLGDMHHGLLVAEPAIAAAYALFGDHDPLRAIAAGVVSGYHAALPLEEQEIALVPTLVDHAARGERDRGGDARACPRRRSVHERERGTAWAALEKLESVHPRFAHAALREACAHAAARARSRASPPGSAA